MEKILAFFKKGLKETLEDVEENCYTDWFEKSIADESIIYYKYSEFKIIRNIGKGSFGVVDCASWKNTDQVFALKRFNGDETTLKEIINEIKLQKRVDFHENILRFHGVTTVKNSDINQEYVLVLEYADSGTLNTYLQNNKLEWDDKYRFALQLASAVACIHECEIIHRDLHADNVFVHQKKLKLADFGLSRKIAVSSNLKLFGLLPYIDPKRLKNQQNYKLNKKSDVYSVGVLMWQISSGYKPYRNDDYDIGLALSIIDGKREEIIDGTPAKYSELYTKCWKYESDERPNMQDVVSILKTLVSPEQNDNVYYKEENISSEKYKSSSKSSVRTDINWNLAIGSEFDNIESESNSSLRSKMSEEFRDGEPKSRTVIKDSQSNIKENNSKDEKPKIKVPPVTHNKNEKTQQTTKQKSRKKGQRDQQLQKRRKKSQKDQQWFDERYSKENYIDITGSKRLNFEGFLKIVDLKNLESINLKKLKLTSLEIRNCSQLDITNLSELIKLTSLSVTGCPKLTTLNCLSNGLTSLEISGCFRLNNNIDLSKFTELKSLYLRGYQNLTTLDCSLIEKLSILKISGCGQLTDIKSSKLEKLSVIDCPKLTTLKYSINGLTSLEISGCKQLKNEIINLSKAPKLTNLTIIDCPKITELDCSSAEKLTELEVSDLTILNCSNTSIKILSLNLCPNIRELNCSNNKELVNLDISNCSRLEFLDCYDSKLTKLDISNCITLLVEYDQNGTNSKRLKYPPNMNLIQKIHTKNLIIVGRTDDDNSTLFNVLTGTDEFIESGNYFSFTKNFQKREFKWKGKYFSVVNTNRVGNTQLSTKKVLYKVLDGIFSIPEGISQILFAIDGRFTADEEKNFNLLKGFIFDIFKIQILEYVTIVRTGFGNFKNKDKCEADKKQLHNENEIIASIVKSCRDVVYVDNPPIDFQISDEDDIEILKNNKRVRKRSREILLNYLDKECQLDYFKLKKWDEIRDDVAKYLQSECEDLPPELEKSKDILALLQLSESYCSIT